MTTTSASVKAGRKAATARLRSVDLTGPEGRLEAVVNEGSPDAPFAALVCHPHPKGGGTLHNKVVYHAMKVLNAPEWGLGWPVLRFNFRGTGLSEGEHDGTDESNDVLAALNWLENEYARADCGGRVQLWRGHGAQGLHGDGIRRARPRCSRPAHACRRQDLPLFIPETICTIPKLFVSGDHDQYAPQAELEAVAASASEPWKLVLVPGADHFFTGQLEAMQQALRGWLKEQAL